MRTVSVIIPTRNESAHLGETLKSLAKVEVETLVVGVHGEPSAAELARQHDATFFACRAGRAAQMNAGAARARGELLLFLHADTQIPDGGIEDLRTCFDQPDVRGGSFRLGLSEAGAGLGLVAWGANLRTRWFGLPYGDQALFCRRDVFWELGGFRDLPIMEDLDFVKRMKTRGKIVCLQSTVNTSSRRWQLNGLIKTTTINALSMTLFCLGVSPQRIRPLYDQLLNQDR